MAFIHLLLAMVLSIYDNYLTHGGRGKEGIGSAVIFQSFRGALASVKSDYEAGLLVDLRSEIRGEVEGDFLEQAHYLLEQNLKDPAAMLVGAVLEDALRQLCQRHGVAEGKSIEAMNAPLKKGNIYNLAQQKQITAWADIRNSAAHGKFGEYSIEQVELMHQGVNDFIVKYMT